MIDRRKFLVKSATALAVTFVVPSLISNKVYAKKTISRKSYK